MPRKLRDSVVVITGASSSVGRATALRMAKAGATLVLASRSEEPLREIAAQCQQFTQRAVAIPVDVADETAVQSLRDHRPRHWNGT